MLALICGVSGQDGSYLAKYLIEKGYDVVGTSRDSMASSFENLEKLKIKDKVKLISMSIKSFRSVLQVVKNFQPDEIYNLAGQTSVGLSFEQPVEAIESITTSTLNILEVIRYLNQDIKFYNAGSSECFGDVGDTAVDENSAFYPKSPYAVAKASAHWLVRSYRESFGIYACTGILFNHESSLRPERFVTQKIVMAANRIKKGSDEVLNLGNLKIERDWGWAPEYVEAMWLIMQNKMPEDFIIATGRSVSLEYFVSKTFSLLDLNWKDYVKVDESLFRAADLKISKANPNKAKIKLGWVAQSDADDVIDKMNKVHL